MILVDTSIWIDHLRTPSEHLAALLEQRLVLTHPFVIGELAMGNLRDRDAVLENLKRLSKARLASDVEVFDFIERNHLWARGIGYVDAHLLASTQLSAFASFWTSDKRLAKAAEDLKLAHIT